MIIEAGDIVGVQVNDWLNDAIRVATGNGPLSHIAIVTATEPFVQVTEALDRVRVRSWDDRLADAAHVWLMKPPLSAEDRAAACRIALKHVGDDYGYINLVWQGMDALTRSRWFTENLVNITHLDICSELADLCEASLGLRPDDVTPNDFYGWFMIEHWPIEQMK